MTSGGRTSWLGTDRGVTWLNVAVNTSLTALKFLVGVLCASQTMIADAVHSAADLVTDFAVLAGLRVSEKPADPCHPYGHARVSTLVGLFVGGALGLAAVSIAYQAVASIHGYLHRHAVPPVEAHLPFWVVLASVPIKELLFRITRNVGKRTGNMSVVANAWHSRADAMVSLAAAVGLLGVILGGPTWRFLDPVTAVVLSVFLLAAAWRIARAAAAELIDRAPDEAMLESIEIIVRGTPGVKDHHAFRARKSGGKVEMDIHVLVDERLTVRQGHDIASAVRDRILRDRTDVATVIVHVEPFDPNRAPPPTATEQTAAAETSA